MVRKREVLGMQCRASGGLTSRDALRRAEYHLSGEGEGVRDEIGFLIIHWRYADHFFPGTSVLHTRLRYALFVPWIYQSLHEDGRSSGPVDKRLERAETRLTGRLRHLPGAIGRDNYPEPTAQPPSARYWSALGAWGILREAGGRAASRAQLHAVLQAGNRGTRDDDGHPLWGAELPFIALPRRPYDWDDAKPTDFDLLPGEAGFLHRQLTQLSPRDAPAERSLLAKLSAGPRIAADACWEAAVGDVAGKEEAARLRRARHAASLAAVGRAVYAALVETLKEEVDGRSVSRKHRDNLPKVLDAHGSTASRLDPGKLLQDAVTIPPVLREVVEQTLAWLASGARDPMALLEAYEHAECFRKQQRARLSRVFGESRRLEWDNDRHPLAEPLHYRWRQVSGLLNDLWAAV